MGDGLFTFFPFRQPATDHRQLFFSIRFHFKRIVAISSSSDEPHVDRAADVGRAHQRSPALELSYMHEFMFVRNVERGGGLPDDNVTERHRQHELSIGKESLDHPLRAPFVELNDWPGDADMPAKTHADETDCQAEQCVGRRPKDGERAKQ